MQHRIVFREITREDIDMHCRFMPEDHEFEGHALEELKKVRLMNSPMTLS